MPFETMRISNVTQRCEIEELLAITELTFQECE